MHDWLKKSLGNLVSFQKGRKVTVCDHLRDGFAPYLGASVLAGGDILEFADTHGSILASERDVLMLWDGERSGLVATGERGVVSSTVTKLTPNAAIDPLFLYYVLDKQFEWIQARRTGTGVPHVPKDLARILVAEYPKEQQEQQRIAEILSTVDEVIEQTEALIAKTQQIKVGLMHDLFTRGVTPDGKLRPPREEAPQLYKKSPLGWIPKEWGCETLENLLAQVACPMRSGPFGSALLKEELVESGIPLLGIDNVFAEQFVSEYRRFVTPHKFVDLNRYAVFPRDVIITIMGTVGRCCVVPEDMGEALSSKHLWTMTFDRSKILPELVCWQLNYASWVNTWFARHSQGAVMDAIQSSTLRTLRLPVPLEDEQQVLRDRHVAVQNMLAAEDERLHKLRQLKRGLMQDLLTGRVPVIVGAGSDVMADAANA
jgi:type I restriction enzyme, S subunit